MYAGASTGLFKLDCMPPTERDLNGVGSSESGSHPSRRSIIDHQGNAYSHAQARLLHTRSSAQPPSAHLSTSRPWAEMKTSLYTRVLWTSGSAAQRENHSPFIGASCACQDRGTSLDMLSTGATKSEWQMARRHMEIQLGLVRGTRKNRGSQSSCRKHAASRKRV